MGATKEGLVFFKVHSKVSHYESTEKLLLEIWESKPNDVKKGFDFVAENHLEMWTKMSEEIAKN